MAAAKSLVRRKHRRGAQAYGEGSAVRLAVRGWYRTEIPTVKYVDRSVTTEPVLQERLPRRRPQCWVRIPGQPGTTRSAAFGAPCRRAGTKVPAWGNESPAAIHRRGGAGPHERIPDLQGMRLGSETSQRGFSRWTDRSDRVRVVRLSGPQEQSSCRGLSRWRCDVSPLAAADQC
jgi:hypothetical protein